METRIEKDLLGEKEVPAQAYWGIHTARALENFPFSGPRVPRELIRALATVKKAACLANARLGYLSEEKAAAIARACDEIAEGGLKEAFPLPALQGGAGTSTNMNLNEVVANRAGERLGDPRGRYARVHPLDDVNRHQSTNDTYPTALKIAAIRALRRLSDRIAALQGAFQRREKAFAGVVALGRTELQSAVPMTLGAQFGAFAEAVARDRWRTFKCEERLRVVNLGGTAVGTGLGAPRRYIFLVTEILRAETGLGLSRGENLVDQTANADVFVEVSGILKAHATNLVKIARDLRLLAAFGEIRLPPLQAGSSLMPGKVNPVILEAAIQAGMRAAACDATVSAAVSGGTLQINEFLPLVAAALLESLTILTETDAALAGFVERIEARPEICRRHMDRAFTLITAFVPMIGYARAQDLLREYAQTAAPAGGSLRAFLEDRLGGEVVRRVLSPENLMSLGHRDEPDHT